MRCLIISGGQFEKIKLKEKYNLIIACDKGYQHAKKLKINPDIIIGDFDSSKIPNINTNIIVVNPVKDDTDTSLAIKYALRNGYKNTDIICALGGRIDHLLANVSIMKYIVDHGGKARIISNQAVIMAVGKGKIRIKKDDSKYLSILAISEKAKVDYIKGTKYDIKNVILKNNFPLGVSNEFKNKYAEIKISKGCVLVITVKNS